MKEIICSNCNTPIKDNFCEHCGQKFTSKSVSFITICSDYVTQILSLERSGLATLVQIILHPKKVIENYWNGYRNFYQSPGKLLFYFVTVAGLHIVFVNNTLFGLIINTNTELLSPQLLLIIITIPLLSLVSFITYRKQKHNYAEHIIAQTYLFSAFGIVFIILDDLLSLITPELDYSMGLILIPVILFWTSLILSKKRKWYFIILNFLLEILVLITILLLLFALSEITGGKGLTIVNT